MPKKMGGRKGSSTGISDFGVRSPARGTYAEASRQSGRFLVARYTVTIVVSEYAVIHPRIDAPYKPTYRDMRNPHASRDPLLKGAAGHDRPV